MSPAPPARVVLTDTPPTARAPSSTRTGAPCDCCADQVVGPAVFRCVLRWVNGTEGLLDGQFLDAGPLGAPLWAYRGGLIGYDTGQGVYRFDVRIRCPDQGFDWEFEVHSLWWDETLDGGQGNYAPLPVLYGTLTGPVACTAQPMVILQGVLVGPYPHSTYDLAIYPINAEPGGG